MQVVVESSWTPFTCLRFQTDEISAWRRAPPAGAFADSASAGPDMDRGALIGDLLAFLVALSFACFIVMIRKYRHVRMAPAAGLGAGMAMLVAWPMAAPLVVTGPDFALLFVFGTVQFGAGLALFATGARLAPAAEVGLVTILEPLLGPIWVWMVLGAHPGSAALIGGAIVLAALLAHTALDVRDARALKSAAANR